VKRAAIFILAIGLALAVHLALLVLMQFDQLTGPSDGASGPRIAALPAVSADARDDLDGSSLFDSAPLFMPTRWNVASNYAGVSGLSEAAKLFDDYPPRMTLELQPPGIPEIPRVSSVEDVLPSNAAFYLSAFGRAPAVPAPFPPSDPAIVVVNMTQALAVYEAPFPRTLLQPARLSSLNGRFSRPAVAHLHVHNQLLAGGPILIESSGDAGLDNRFLEAIAEPGFYLELPSGIYRVSLFP
jgi:hypothetical protein